MSFENYTIANAIKNIARSINAIPKLQAVVSFSSGPAIWKVDNFILTFVNRSGLDTAIPSGNLNDLFPTAYEKNMNSSDQFLTRSVSNITNAKSSSLVISPLNGGFKIITPNSLIYNPDNAIVYLPSKIDKIDFIRVYPTIELVARGGVGPTNVVLYTNYYTDKLEWSSIIESLRATLTTTYLLTNEEVDTAKSALPDPILQAQFNYGDSINKTSSGYTKTFFEDKLTIKNKFDFDTIDISSNTDVQDRTCHWKPFTNELIMSKTFRYGLDVFGFVNFYEANQYRLLVEGDGLGAYELYLKIKSIGSGFFTDRVRNDEVLIQVGYYPIADIKVSIDNDNDSQDEKFYNQSGKVIDAVSVSKLITAHTNDSVEGTKIRNARYQSPDEDFSDILPLGQIVRDSNNLYVVSQRSIDGLVNNASEYYNVIYTLSRNRIARSENIIADSAVINYKTPDDNLVFRNQLYKDYIEFSLQSIHNQTPYLALNKLFTLNSTLAGTNFDYTVLAKNEYGATPDIVRYVRSPTIFDLHKSKLMNIDWQDNNLLGYRLDSTGDDYVQTPIVYTDDAGKATDFELLFCNTKEINDANTDFNDPSVVDLLAPFGDLTEVDEDFYDDDIVTDNRFSIRIQEPDYDKDPFEIPVFEYMVQANDDYNALGNTVVGNDLFTNFNGQFHYVINNTTRFTAENANDLWVEPADQFQKSFIVTRSGTYQEILDLDLYNDGSLFPLGRNEALIKNIGFYVKNGANIKFLFAINDYVESGANDRDDIRLYINNWKI
jgi:hypothetical protein